MSIINELERTELLECVREYGFCKGSEVLWLHLYKNLPSNKYKSRTQIEYEVIERFRIPKLSKSTFDKTYSLLNKISLKLDKDTHKKFKLYAVEQNTSMSKIIKSHINELLNEDNK